MITSEMVKHIQGTLNGLTKGKNTNFGQDLDAGDSAPDSGILVVLTDGENVDSLSNSIGKKVLASSTVLGKDDVDIFSAEGKTINVINIPYSETISVEKGTAKGFAIVQVASTNLKQENIVGSNENADPRKKYIIDNTKLEGCSVLFSGTISTTQTIEENNSFSLSNIKITFN